MGLEKFNEFRKFARDVGAVIGTELTDASQRLIAQGFKVRAVIRGIRNDLALGLIPILTDAAEATVAWWKANREVIVSKFRFWIRIVREAFDSLWFALHRLDNLVNTFTNWGTVFSGITAAVIALTVALGALAATGLGLGILAVAAALVGGILGALGTAFGLIFSAPTAMVLAFVAAVAALVLIFEDLLTFVQGGESVFGHFLEWLLGSKEAADSVQKMLGLLADVIKNGLLISFNYLFDGIVHDLGQAFDLIMKKIGEVVGFFLNLFGLGDSFSMGGFLGKGIEGATTFLEAQAADTAAILAAQRAGGGATGGDTTTNQTFTLHGLPDPAAAANKLSVMKQNAQARRER